MPTKIIGIVLLLITSSASGVMVSSRIKQRLRELGAYAEFERHVISSLEGSGMSTYNIFKSFDNEVLSGNELFEQLERAAVSARDGRTWRTIFADCPDSTRLNAQDIDLICEFAAKLEDGELWSQLSRGADIERKLCDRCEELSERLKGQSELFKWLGMLCGAFVALILY